MMKLDAWLDAAFLELSGGSFSPFKWQRRAFHDLLAGKLPDAVDIPTGCGKTSIIALWILAYAAQRLRNSLRMISRGGWFGWCIGGLLLTRPPKWLGMFSALSRKALLARRGQRFARFSQKSVHMCCPVYQRFRYRRFAVRLPRTPPGALILRNPRL
jgi:hypothetical protein